VHGLPSKELLSSSNVPIKVAAEFEYVDTQ
jgi:hypothetical protein